MITALNGNGQNAAPRVEEGLEDREGPVGDKMMDRMMDRMMD